VPGGICTVLGITALVIPPFSSGKEIVTSDVAPGATLLLVDRKTFAEFGAVAVPTPAFRMDTETLTLAPGTADEGAVSVCTTRLGGANWAAAASTLMRRMAAPPV